MTADVLLDEHVNRVFERVLEERSFQVEQAKDRFGERTTDRELLRWCGENDVLLVTNNVKDFEPLHRRVDHAGLFVYHDQRLPDVDPEGLARTMEVILDQYESSGVADQLIDLEEWYEWLHS